MLAGIGRNQDLSAVADDLVDLWVGEDLLDPGRYLAGGDGAQQPAQPVIEWAVRGAVDVMVTGDARDAFRVAVDNRAGLLEEPTGEPVLLRGPCWRRGL
jgi:hypothetical protein